MPFLLPYSKYLQNLIRIGGFAQKFSGTKFHRGHNSVNVAIPSQHRWRVSSSAQVPSVGKNGHLPMTPEQIAGRTRD